MPLPSWLRTYSFRITLLYIALIGAAMAIVFAVLYRTTDGFMEKQLRSTIRSDMAALVGTFEAVGIDDLAEIVAHRTGSGHHSSFYLLQDPAGRKAAGNLPAMAPASGWREVP